MPDIGRCIHITGLFGKGNKMYYTAGERFTAFLASLLAVLAAIAILIIAASPKMEDGTTRIFGHELRLVATNSMADNGNVDTSGYKIGSFDKDTLVAVECVPDDEKAALDWYAGVKVGDVLTVRYTYNVQMTITHRVTEVRAKDDGSGYIISLKGDNYSSDAGTLSQVIDTSDPLKMHYVIGRVVWKSHTVGVIVGAAQRAIKAIVEG